LLRQALLIAGDEQEGIQPPLTSSVDVLASAQKLMFVAGERTEKLRRLRRREEDAQSTRTQHAIVALHGPHQLNVPIQPAMACPISSGESS
jgi:hypothetical protein